MSRRQRRNNINNNPPSSQSTYETNPTVKSFGMLSDPASGRFFSNTISNSGLPVTTSTALTVPSVYAAIRAISEDIGKLSLSVVRPTPNRTGFTPFLEHPLNDVIENPNDWQSSYDFRSFAAASWALRGNSYTVIVRANDGFTPTSLIPINPDICAPHLTADGSVVYVVSHPLLEEGGAIFVRAEDMLHIKNLSLNGWVGISPISVMTESIGLGLALQTNAANLFGNGSNPGGILKMPGQLSAESAKRLAESWRQAYSGVQNAGKIAVLEDGMDFSRLSLTADESQLLESRKFQTIEICRAFRIPPHKIFSLDDAHYSNIESMNIAYINDALVPFTQRWEAEARSKLIMPAERRAGVAVKFDFDSLVRDDTKTRFSNYAIGIQNGWLSADDVRRLEGLSDLPEGQGQIYRVSLATVPATSTNEPDTVSPTDPGNPSQESSKTPRKRVTK